MIQMSFLSFHHFQVIFSNLHVFFFSCKKILLVKKKKNKYIFYRVKMKYNLKKKKKNT